jgi:hypothetical protein
VKWSAYSAGLKCAISSNKGTDQAAENHRVHVNKSSRSQYRTAYVFTASHFADGQRQRAMIVSTELRNTLDAGDETMKILMAQMQRLILQTGEDSDRPRFVPILPLPPIQTLSKHRIVPSVASSVAAFKLLR